MAILKKKPATKTVKSPKKPLTKKTAAKKPVAKKAATGKPVPKKAVAKKTAVKTIKSAKKPAAKKPVAKKAATGKPVSQKAVAKKAATKTIVKVLGMSEQMLDAALKVLDERQAMDVVTVPLAGRSAIADYMIIASGRAGRQVVALADHLREAFFKLGVRSVRVEGQNDANWVLVDAGDVIIHLFLPDVRRYYDLDALWAKKPSKK